MVRLTLQVFWDWRSFSTLRGNYKPADVERRLTATLKGLSGVQGVEVKKHKIYYDATAEGPETSPQGLGHLFDVGDKVELSMMADILSESVDAARLSRSEEEKRGVVLVTSSGWDGHVSQILRNLTDANLFTVLVYTGSLNAFGFRTSPTSEVLGCASTTLHMIADILFNVPEETSPSPAADVAPGAVQQAAPAESKLALDQVLALWEKKEWIIPGDGHCQYRAVLAANNYVRGWWNVKGQTHRPCFGGADCEQCDQQPCCLSNQRRASWSCVHCRTLHRDFLLRKQCIFALCPDPVEIFDMRPPLSPGGMLIVTPADGTAKADEIMSAAQEGRVPARVGLVKSTVGDSLTVFLHQPTDDDVIQLRSAVADYLEMDANGDPAPTQVPWPHREPPDCDLDKYLPGIRGDSWGDGCTLIALAEILEAVIVVVNSSGGPTVAKYPREEKLATWLHCDGTRPKPPDKLLGLSSDYEPLKSYGLIEEDVLTDLIEPLALPVLWILYKNGNHYEALTHWMAGSIDDDFPVADVVSTSATTTPATNGGPRPEGGPVQSQVIDQLSAMINDRNVISSGGCEGLLAFIDQVSEEVSLGGWASSVAVTERYQKRSRSANRSRTLALLQIGYRRQYFKCGKREKAIADFNGCGVGDDYFYKLTELGKACLRPRVSRPRQPEKEGFQFVNRRAYLESDKGRQDVARFRRVYGQGAAVGQYKRVACRAFVTSGSCGHGESCWLVHDEFPTSYVETKVAKPPPRVPEEAAEAPLEPQVVAAGRSRLKSSPPAFTPPARELLQRLASAPGAERRSGRTSSLP